VAQKKLEHVCYCGRSDLGYRYVYTLSSNFLYGLYEMTEGQVNYGCKGASKGKVCHAPSLCRQPGKVGQ